MQTKTKITLAILGIILVVAALWGSSKLYKGSFGDFGSEDRFMNEPFEGDFDITKFPTDDCGLLSDQCIGGNKRACGRHQVLCKRELSVSAIPSIPAAPSGTLHISKAIDSPVSNIIVGKNPDLALGRWSLRADGGDIRVSSLCIDLGTSTTAVNLDRISGRLTLGRYGQGIHSIRTFQNDLFDGACNKTSDYINLDTPFTVPQNTINDLSLNIDSYFASHTDNFSPKIKVPASPSGEVYANTFRIYPTKLNFGWEIPPSYPYLPTGNQVEVARFIMGAGMFLMYHPPTRNLGTSSISVNKINFDSHSTARMTNFTLHDITNNVNVATHADSADFENTAAGGNLSSIMLRNGEQRTFKILADVADVPSTAQWRFNPGGPNTSGSATWSIIESGTRTTTSEWTPLASNQLSPRLVSSSSS